MSNKIETRRDTLYEYKHSHYQTTNAGFPGIINTGWCFFLFADIFYCLVSFDDDDIVYVYMTPLLLQQYQALHIHPIYLSP